MQHPPPSKAYGPAINRFLDVMEHSDRSFVLVARLTTALEKVLGFRIDPRDLIAESGEFLTRYCCDLAHCNTGCLPSSAYDEFGDLKSSFTHVESGAWVTSRYPNGYQTVTKKQ